MYTPAKAGKIIIACAVLHNIMISRNYPLPTLGDDDDALDTDNNDGNNDNDDEDMSGNRQLSAMALRARMINTHFNN